MRIGTCVFLGRIKRYLSARSLFGVSFAILNMCLIYVLMLIFILSMYYFINMEFKDIVSIFLSLAAFFTSLFALYFSHFHKPASAVLTFCARYLNIATKEKGMSRELIYTLSNTGKQGLYIKDISVLLGSSPLGPLRAQSSYLVIETDPIKPCVLHSGDIKEIKLVHEVAYDVPEDYKILKKQFIIVCLQLISSDGKRYELVHDVTNLGPAPPELSDEIWQGVPLGKHV
ncbi:hypothetical protein [Aeromonas veronii]|uniref:hypothetical protein n=1 Tax=Aeromonas veronii TaxID=654 RepID=UPI0038B5EEDA